MQVIRSQMSISLHHLDTGMTEQCTVKRSPSKQLATSAGSACKTSGSSKRPRASARRTTIYRSGVARKPSRRTATWPWGRVARHRRHRSLQPSSRSPWSHRDTRRVPSWRFPLRAAQCCCGGRRRCSLRSARPLVGLRNLPPKLMSPRTLFPVPSRISVLDRS